MRRERFATGAPADRTALLTALRHVHADGHAFALALPVARGFAPQGDRWSLAEHLRHLTRSTAPVAHALRVPRWLLRLRFGTASVPSRDFDTLVADYRAALAAGGQAGRFAPSPEAPPIDPLGRRARILTAWHDSVRALDAAAVRWSEPTLDRYRLPHPLLGLLTVREMLAFTVYHTAHHLRLVEARLSGADDLS